MRCLNCNKPLKTETEQSLCFDCLYVSAESKELEGVEE